MSFFVKSNREHNSFNPVGKKTHVKIQVGISTPISEEGRKNFNFAARRKMKARNNLTSPQFVPVNKISNREDLADFIYENYGTGKFTLNFFSRGVVNKKYKKFFKCKLNNCSFWSKCKVKRRVISGEFNSCKKNRRVIANWTKRASLVIREKNGVIKGDEKGFYYKFLYDKMYMFWFWEKKQKLESKEDFDKQFF